MHCLALHWSTLTLGLVQITKGRESYCRHVKRLLLDSIAHFIEISFLTRGDVDGAAGLVDSGGVGALVGRDSCSGRHGGEDEGSLHC